MTREYTWGLNAGGGIGGLLNMHQGGTDYSYLYDGKGNVMAVIDSSQSVVASYRYSPFGKLLSKSGTLDQPFTFSTKRYDENTGLNYFGFRYYNPAIGRWLSIDPLGEAGGMNLYGFVENSPINFIDPYGNHYMQDGLGNYKPHVHQSPFVSPFPGKDMLNPFSPEHRGLKRCIRCDDSDLMNCLNTKAIGLASCAACYALPPGPEKFAACVQCGAGPIGAGICIKEHCREGWIDPCTGECQ